jgi:hypothetical protein
MICFVLKLLPIIVCPPPTESHATHFCTTCSVVYVPHNLTFQLVAQLLAGL